MVTLEIGKNKRKNSTKRLSKIGWLKWAIYEIIILRKRLNTHFIFIIYWVIIILSINDWCNSGQIVWFKIQNIFVFTYKKDWSILESGKHSLTVALRLLAAVIRRLCSTKNRVNLVSAFCVRISMEEFFVQAKEPIEVYAHLSFSLFWLVTELKCLIRPLAPPWLYHASLVHI